VVSFTSQPLYHLGYDTVVGPRARLGCCGEKKNIAFAGNRTRTVSVRIYTDAVESGNFIMAIQGPMPLTDEDETLSCNG
jgi:hypothetical protein